MSAMFVSFKTKPSLFWMLVAMVLLSGRASAGEELIVPTTTVAFDEIKQMPLEDAMGAWCGYGQWQLEQFSDEDFTPEIMATHIYDDPADFFSKPSVKDGQIQLHAFVTEGEAASQGYHQIWCKMKTPIGIHNGGITLVPEAESHQQCNVLNQAAIEWALQQVPDTVRDAFQNHVSIDYQEDKAYSRGDLWYLSKMKLESTGADSYAIQASALRTSSTVEDPKMNDVIEAVLILLFGGMNYCKVLSPEGALQFVQDAAAVQITQNN